jgi:hypothetical protein
VTLESLAALKIQNCELNIVYELNVFLVENIKGLSENYYTIIDCVLYKIVTS